MRCAGLDAFGDQSRPAGPLGAAIAPARARLTFSSAFAARRWIRLLDGDATCSIPAAGAADAKPAEPSTTLDSFVRRNAAATVANFAFATVGASVGNTSIDPCIEPAVDRAVVLIGALADSADAGFAISASDVDAGLFQTNGDNACFSAHVSSPDGTHHEGGGAFEGDEVHLPAAVGVVAFRGEGNPKRNTEASVRFSQAAIRCVFDSVLAGDRDAKLGCAGLNGCICVDLDDDLCLRTTRREERGHRD